MANTKPPKVADDSEEITPLPEVLEERALLPAVASLRQVHLVALDFIEFRAAPGEPFTALSDDAEAYIALGRAVAARDYPKAQLIPFDITLENEVIVP